MDQGQRLIEVTGEGRIEGLHWGAIAPYVMFITGRCGSTWLAELLASTELAGNPREWLNSEIAVYSEALETGTLGGYFTTVVSNTSQGGRFGMQIDATRLRDTRSLVDWPSAFPNDRATTFFMYRRDLLAQAWSWAYALGTGVWHTADLARVEQTEYVPTMRELAAQMVDIRRGEEYLSAFWSQQAYQPRFIEFEAFVADPAGTVATMLNDLRVPTEQIVQRLATLEAPTDRMSYSEARERAMSKFAETNREALDALERDRFGVSSSTLSTMLVAE